MREEFGTVMFEFTQANDQRQVDRFFEFHEFALFLRCFRFRCGKRRIERVELTVEFG
ncbi:hypothetical protein [Hydrogenophilus thermoluteolus]|uniref:hypothetical protein n=1 Tax=Hydrogenophilus thermoluteolus TaxID=297 RepID=UPI003F680152